MPAPPRKCRLRFEITALMALIAAVAIPLSWIAYHLRWIRQQRHQFIEAHENEIGNKLGPHAYIYWPGPIVFNEMAVHAWSAKKMTAAEVAEARRLFPEAEIQDLPNP